MLKLFTIPLAVIFFGYLALQGRPYFRPAPVMQAPSSHSTIGSCINLGAALEAVRGENWGYKIKRRDFDVLSKQGFDTVRLPVRWSDYTGPGPNYTIEKEFFKIVDGVIADAFDARIKVILDVHHFTEFNEDPDKHKAKLLAIWHQLSEHYKNYSEELIFELLNEPHFENVKGVNEDASGRGIQRMNQINQELLNIVRRKNPRRWVVIGSSQWGSMSPFIGPKLTRKFVLPNDPRIILTFHYYAPMAFTHQNLRYDKTYPRFREWGTRADLAAVERDIRKMSKYRAETRPGLDIFLGEFGSSLNEVPTRERARYAQAVVTAARKNGFSWCYWDFASDAFGIFNSQTGQWSDDILYGIDPKNFRQRAR